MKHFAKSMVVALALLVSAGAGFAADVKAAGKDVPEAAKGIAAPAKEAVKGKVAEAKAKLVDLNSAVEAELKAIPGIGDAYAAKIIAGRPYANKAQLKSRKIIPANVYETIKDKIIAKQPQK